MTIVNFPPELGGDNVTIDDTDNPSTGLGNGGHRLRFVLALQQFLKVAAWCRGTAATVLGYRNDTAASRDAAAGFEEAAATSAGEAASSRDAAAASLSDFRGRWYGALAADPATDPLGGAVNEGDAYGNTTLAQVRLFLGGAWRAAFAAADASAVTFSQFGAGAVAQNAQQKLRRWVDAEDYGWPTREAGAAMNDAIAAAVALGVGEVRFRSPHYNQQTPIVLQSGVVIVGPGSGPQGEIRVAAGVAIDAQIQTANFETQYVSKPGSYLNGVTINAGFKNLCLNGNKANVPAVTDWRKGLGFRCYWMSPVIDNVRVQHISGIGGISAYPANGRVFPGGYVFAPNFDTDIKEGYIDKLSFNDTMYEGFIFEGPSDLKVRSIFCGWPANSLTDITYNSAKKSLKFTTGGLVAARVTNGGAGYTTATVTVGGAGSGATAEAVIAGGVITRILVNTEGYDYDRASTTITITGDGTGATAVAYVDDTIDGIVFNDDGAELGFLHSFNNYHGWNHNFRNTSNGFPRVKGEFIMGESGWGNVRIGGHVRYQIARVDTHVAGLGGGPGVFPSLLVRSDRGGSIASWEDYRAATSDFTANGATSLLLDGINNRVDNGVIFGRGQTGDGVTVRGHQNSARASVSGLGGTSAALVHEQGAYGCNVEILSDSNPRCWRNQQTVAGLAGFVRINNGGYTSGSTQFENLDSMSPNQWRLIDIVSRATNGAIAYAKQVITGAGNATITTEQTITINHAIVRTPNISDCVVSLRPGTSVTPGVLEYAYVSAVTSTQITVKLKYNTAGTGANGINVQVNIG